MLKKLLSLTTALVIVPMGLSIPLAPSASAVEACSNLTPALNVTVTCTTVGFSSISVPAGSGAVQVIAIGGGGASGYNVGSTFKGGAGGAGARVEGKIKIPGNPSAITISVGSGGKGLNSSGVDAKSAGFSAVVAESDPLVVAGGGGQGGEGRLSEIGGAGGNGAAANTQAGGSGATVASATGAGGNGGSNGVGGAGGSAVGRGVGMPGQSWADGGLGGNGFGSPAPYGRGGSGYGGGGGAGAPGSNNEASGGGGAGGSYVHPTFTSGVVTFGPSMVTAGAGGVAPTPFNDWAAGNDGSVQITFLPAPTISGVAPITGPVSGGTSIAISGTGLQNTSSVTFGSSSVTPDSASSTRVTATMPTGFGTKNVSVITPDGSATAVDAFTYQSPTISGISPSSGSANGGSSVMIDGTNMTYVTGVTFGGIPATDLIVTNTRVTVITPALTATGAVDVVVTASGPASVTSTGGYTFAADTPRQPSAVTATAGIESATVSWIPGANGGQSILGYTVAASSGSFTCITTATSCTITGLAASVAYTFTVTARNASGSSSASAASNSITAQPRTVPGAPTVESVVPGIEKVTVSWTAPASTGGGAIIEYTVASNPVGFSCTTSSISCSIMGLTGGSTYSFSVVATNSVGPSTASSSSASIIVLSATVPSAPRNAAATAGVHKAIVAWDAPSNDGGRTVIDYTVTSSPGAFTCTTAGTSCEVTGLDYLNTYTFTIVARNTIGSSVASGATAPPITPQTPTLISLTPNTGSINGGTRVVITGTNLSGATQVTLGGINATVVSSTSITITITTPAMNAAGAVNIEVTVPGPASVAAGNAFTFLAVAPGAPASVSGVAGIESATVSWTTPAQLGGGTFSYYQVASNPGSSQCLTYSSSTTSCVITGLTSGTPYTFDVVAVTSVGSSSSASSGSMTPLAATAPAAPTSVIGTPGVNQVSVSWTAPVINGGRVVIGYAVTASGTLVRMCTTTGATTCSVTGLNLLTAYTFTVKAINVMGTSTASVPSVSVVTLAPSISSVSPNTGPANGLTSVTITGTNLATATSVTFGGVAGTLVSATSTTVVVTTPPVNSTGLVDVVVGLAEDVTAIAGDSFNYAQATPGAPTSVIATNQGVSSVLISWSPGVTGGSTITGYRVNAVSSGLTCATTGATSCTIADLLPGVSYTFTVTATNVVGTSAPSLPSAALSALFPSITSLSPSSGVVAGGTVIVISGTNLANTIGVTFDGVAAVVQSTAATTAQVVTPARANVGQVTVVLVVTGPASVIVPNAFTYVAGSGGGGGGGSGGGSGGSTSPVVENPTVVPTTPVTPSPELVQQVPVVSALALAESALVLGDVKSLTPSVLSLIPSAVFAVVSRSQVAQFSAIQVKALSVSQLRAITPFALKGMTAKTVKALTLKQLSGLTTKQKAALTKKQREALDSKQKAALITKLRR